jgi:NOL1/NOP2/fmu family ribosome biogenesis protein
MMDLSKPVRVLDLCAAPGGKSTLMQSLVSRDSLLLANEVIKSRVPVLHQNLVKWGLPNGFISHNDPEAFGRLPGFFDLLLVDAPCSGSGLFRRDPAAAGEWSAEAVKLCSRRQQRILTGAWPSLKENGILIYSTCSYSPEENEEQVDHLLGHFNCESLRLAIDPAWNIVETLSPKANGYGYRFYPDKLKGEGFFLAVLRKKEGTARLPDSRQKPEWPDKKEETLLRKFIPDQNLRFIRIGEGIHVLPAPLIQVLPLLKERLYLKKAGVLAGRMARDEWIPDHELALCTALDPGMPGLELPVAGALHYLRRETLVPPVAGKGWLPVRFQGLSLGWAKLLSGRINNYYPKSWRILH